MILIYTVDLHEFKAMYPDPSDLMHFDTWLEFSSEMAFLSHFDIAHTDSLIIIELVYILTAQDFLYIL